MAAISACILARLSLDVIERIAFYKRDEITSDLICCDVTAGDQVWTFNEEMAGWDTLIEHLERLPGFRGDWLAAVSQPPFEASETVAFSR